MNQTELAEMKTMSYVKKNVLPRINDILDISEENTNKLKDTAIETKMKQ